MSRTTKVSVLMPVRDGAEFLTEALDSILAQTFPDFEFVVVDDGSRDATPSILDACAARDSRVRILKNPGAGIVDALNFGLKMATAPLIARMDADDRARPERLAIQHSYMTQNTRVLAVGMQMQRFIKQGHIMRPSRQPLSADAVRTTMMRACCIIHPTVMMRRSAVLAVGGYRKEFLQAQDYDLWLRLLDKGDLVNLDIVGLDYRLHGAMTSVRHSEIQAFQATAARLLADMRLKGMAEPGLGAGEIDAQTLSRLGMSEREIAQMLRKALFHSARFAWLGKDKAALRRCLAHTGPWRLPNGGFRDIVDYARQWIGVFW